MGGGQVKNLVAFCLCLHSLSEAKFRNNGLIHEREEAPGHGSVKPVSQLLLMFSSSSPGRKDNKQQKNKKSLVQKRD